MKIRPPCHVTSPSLMGLLRLRPHLIRRVKQLYNRHSTHYVYEHYRVGHVIKSTLSMKAANVYR